MPGISGRHDVSQTSSANLAAGDQVKPVPASKESSNGASPMNNERLKNLYATMLKCRMIKQRLRRHNGYGGIGGEEATEVGAAIHLRSTDFVAPSVRDLIPNYLKGAPLNVILSRYARQKKHGATHDIAPHIAPPSTLVTQLTIATGVALASKVQQQSQITLAMIDDPGEPQNRWDETVSFAVANNLAIIYLICTCAGKRQKNDSKLRRRAQELEIPGITVDGNDVVAVYRVTEETMRRSRQGLGPSIIECALEHARDPVRFMEGYLVRRNLWSAEWKQKIIQDFHRELARAFDASA